ELAAMPHRDGAFLQMALAEAVMPFLPEKLWETVHCWRHGKDKDHLPDWCGLNPDWGTRMRVKERARAFVFEATFRGMPSTLAPRRALLSGSEESGDLSQAMEVIGGVPRRDPTSYRPFFE